MKILFVINEILFADHISISYLSAIAKELGHSTYLCILKENNLSLMITNIKPEVVAYSANIASFKNIVRQHKIAKKENNFISIMGGPQATFSPETFFESGVDAYCIGEGEYVFKDFLNKVNKKESYYDIPNLITEKGKNDVRFLIEDINKLPEADRDLVLSNTYLKDVPKKTFYATRGCPYSCNYCLTGDSVVITSKGKNKKIKDIKKGDKVISFDENKKEMVENEVIDFFCREIDKILEIETEEGNKIKITPNHKIYTINGWVESSSLKIGDKILLIDYKDKISFNKKLYNPAKMIKVREKISKTISLQKEILSKRTKKRWEEGTLVGHPMSDKNKLNFSNRMKNNNPMKNKKIARKVGDILKKKYEEEDHPNKGKKRIDASKYMSEHNPMKNPKIANDPDRIRKLSLSLGGTGIPYELRIHPKEFSNNLKRKIRKRDLYKCQLCGCNKSGYGKKKKIRELSVHHVDYDKNNNEECNLISLCDSCHAKTLVKRQFWEKFFKEKMLTYINCPHFVRIKSVKIINKKIKVYNFECIPNNNYFANYILVHNCCNNYYNKLYKGKGLITRRFSVERIIKEIENVKSKYRTDFIKFGDDIFVFKADEWLEEFAEKYRGRINIPFNCYLRFDIINDDVLKLLKKAGCFSVHLSVDSTSVYLRENILNRKMKKNINIEEKLKEIKKYGINTWVNYMLAIPESTIKDDLKTIIVSKKSKVTFSHYTITDPIKGTKLFEYCIKNNIIDSSHEGFAKMSERSVLSCFSNKEKNIQQNIYLVGSLISKLPFPFYNMAIWLIKKVLPNKIFEKLNKWFYNYNINHTIYKLSKK